MNRALFDATILFCFHQNRKEPQDCVEDAARRPPGWPELYRTRVCRHAAQAHRHKVASSSGTLLFLHSGRNYSMRLKKRKYIERLRAWYNIQQYLVMSTCSLPLQADRYVRLLCMDSRFFMVLALWVYCSFTRERVNHPLDSCSLWSLTMCSCHAASPWIHHVEKCFFKRWISITHVKPSSTSLHI